MSKPVVRFPTVSLKNLVYYIHQTDVEPFIQINYKCCKAVESLSTNPWSEYSDDKSDLTVKRILKYFPKLELLQVDPVTANTLSDETLSKVHHIRIIQHSHDDPKITNEKVLKLCDTLYTLKSEKPKEPMPNITRAYFNNKIPFIYIAKYITDFPNVKYIERAINEIRKHGDIKIHLKFEVRDDDVYNQFDNLRNMVGIRNLYFSSNEVKTTGVYLLIPPKISARDLKNIFYTNGKLAN
ncbi:hypothetical protein EIN_195950 [Entamoeba invadens IP1]|uniref:Uncharacterized protein n=1 Tax=Entamoeba invadens IP1 TaxID=370355 RepID=A0A0A1U6U4_ENTIV|nr:hypothetical protein EIN_195950 [Entamoeba invadens IP1]ELP88603.1 hypothetical protein EIN_195950 [Entamoeba invadens IP1]|eukprot:XP_004255374.1 hypothetical protein EIN_195950 [Entamoeba invadens IP1]